MRTHNLGYPRIGSQRELKHACENFWAGKITAPELLQVGRELRQTNWQIQKQAGIDLIPSNDFSFYDHVLDTSLMVGNIPERFRPLLTSEQNPLQHSYFAMARGYQDSALDITALEMTKWFDTNYHYLVPEFQKDQSFQLFSSKVIDEFIEAKDAGIITKPVLLGPVSYLLLGKEKEEGFHRLDLLDALLPVYDEVLKLLQGIGAEWVQIDEPCLVLDLTKKQREAYLKAYKGLTQKYPNLKFILATYFGDLGTNLEFVSLLPFQVLHLDLVRCPGQLERAAQIIPQHMSLSLGLIDGRNIWKNDFEESLKIVEKALKYIEKERLLLAPSCSLLHVPCDLDFETDEKTLPLEIKQWMSFAKQKLSEVVTLARIKNNNPFNYGEEFTNLIKNSGDISTRKNSKLVHDPAVKARLANVTNKDLEREIPYPIRRELQQRLLHLPLFPTTTIGSFPQTGDIRGLRAKFKKGQLTQEQYEQEIKTAIESSIRWQEQIGMDVLVHGEFERNDMVEYFGEQLKGFAFTQNGWVQSYGSRCVKPPVIYGDVSRPTPMTVEWTAYAQSLTSKPVKGMLTGPVTILQWSFVRNDQPRSETAMQIALAIRNEVMDLERAGIKVIQVDEPAIREGLPLRKADWPKYLKWAVDAFKLSVAGVLPHTQVHTHMCYSEFNDIIEAIADMDADVITIETSRSQMELLNVFSYFKYPNDIGPGVYDIHSPRVPTVDEMVELLEKAAKEIHYRQLWVNPDCGLKTRGWDETLKALTNMIGAANVMRKSFTV
jgi:5-methyltetrahydropteroyltriglutamate--homocysteine methyltransferase